jgi:hypothetical protein
VTDYIFLPVATGQTIIWTNTALWSTATVPNAADASVYIPAVLFAQSAQVYNFNLDIPPGQSFSIASLAVAQDTLDVQGNLTIADDALLGAGAALYMQGGIFAAGALKIAASPQSGNGILGIFGNGSVAVGGAMVNDGAITRGGCDRRMPGRKIDAVERDGVTFAIVKDMRRAGSANEEKTGPDIAARTGS